MPSSSRNETIHVNPGHYLPSLERSESSSSNPHHQQYSSSFPSSSSSYPSRPDSLIVNSHSCSTSSVPSPLIDISSASSTASSYFIPTPALYEADEQPHDLNACKSLNHHHHHSERSLGRSSSQRTTALDRSRSLLRAGRGRYEEDSHHHNRASVYTTQTSASDWARERENEMRNSKSGIFDLEYELQESRSGSSNEGHEVVSSQQVSQRRIQGNGDNEDYIITEEDNQDSIGNQSAMSSASTSEFIAVSQPISPTSPSSMSSSMQLQTQLLNPQERLRLPKPLLPLPSPTSPTSPNSSAGFGLGITSDDAIHPIGNSALPPSVSSSSITGSPDSLSFTDTQLPDQPYEGSTLSSSSTAPKGRWSTTRAYIRRNTNSSLRSLNRQQSKSSLLDLQSITTTTNATTMNATFDNPTRSPSHHSSLQQSSGYTSLSEHLQSSQKQSSQQEQTRDDASPSAFPGYTNEPENIGYSRFGQNQQMTFSSSSMMEKSVSSLSSPYNNENSGTSSTHAPGMDSSRSAYTSNANSYLSTDSLVGDEREDINSQESPRKPNIRGLGMVDAGLIMDFPNADNSTTRPPSQAVAMAESGKGKVTRIEPFENIEHLQISSDTTHLIFNGVSSQPVLLSNLLSTSLPGIADKLLVLDISNCSLSNIPQSIFLCSNLEELNISGNTQINGTLPPFIRSLISLRVLLADSCGLNSISHSFANLKHLHTLALRNNSLKYLPSWISRLSNSLELLLLDDNPFYGDYADLVKSCSQLRHQSSSTSPSPTTEVPSPTRQISANPSSEAFAVEEEADNSFASNASARADSLESQEQNDVFLPGRIPAAVPKPPRTSLLSRTGSVRLALSRSMSISDNIPATQSSSPVNSLLLADSSSQASTARRRASILKPMKSMGDLNASQPSIHELISPSDKENLLPSMRFPASPAFPISPSFSDASTMESNTSTSSSARPSPILMQGQPSFRKSIAGSFAARRSRKSSRGLTALEFIASEVAESRGSQAPPNFPEPVSSANVSPVTTSADEKGRDGRPGFFKKLSMGVTRRRKSNSALNSDAATPPMPSSPPPPLPTEQAELGIGRPPFLNNGSLRSTSAPDSVSTRRPFSSRENAPEGLPPMPRSTTGLPDSPSTTWKSSIQSSIMENSRRYRKKSRPPIPEPLLELAKQEEESKPNRRRSYLMLNSVLPPVVSPGPLALTFSVSHGEDQTIHAKSQLHTLDEEQSPTTDQDLSQQATVVQSPADANLPAFNEWSVEQRKAALAPLLAYLRDLDDLARVPEAKQAESSAPVMTRRTDSSRVPQRKASSAAVSVNSSQLPDRSSGYDSSAKGDSTALTSPSSVQGPISKMKDDANKRDVSL